MVEVDTRKNMTDYWKEFSVDPTIETIMLDSNAKELHNLEKAEILSKMPPLENKDVIELAAGIGRYTPILAKTAKSLLAVEFMEEFHKKNQEINGNLPNVKFLCADVTKMEQEEESLDLVFSNWLLMYLGDAEVKDFARKALRWIRPGGHVFFRESCFRRSGDAKRTTNPTHYRHPEFYVAAFRSAFFQDNNGNLHSFELVSSSSVTAYRKLKNNPGQICFLWRKVTKACTGSPQGALEDFQQFLDKQQYSNQSIRRYERIFGSGYVSTGGQKTTTEFVSKLQLKAGQRVLDVGCGIGGGDFYMAKEFNVSVVGVDLSTNMIHMALENAQKCPSLDVEFEICDATEKEYPDESFDVIYSRDTILHIQDKQTLFRRFYKWLKPGGQLLISDYCCGDQLPSTRFTEYVKNRGYHLLSPAKYGQVIESAGFESVKTEDRTEQFVEILKDELQRTEAEREVFIKETSEGDFNAIIDGWKAKVSRCGDGDQKWGLFLARKPL